MARINCFDPISLRIESMPEGEVFIISDFSDLADDAAIRKVLSRLEDDGAIRRIMRGVYDCPEYSEFLDEYIEPKPDKVAHALARNYGWTIVPCGDTALNMLDIPRIISVRNPSKVRSENAKSLPSETALTSSEVISTARFLLRPITAPTFSE